jgi:hypothetical protein
MNTNQDFKYHVLPINTMPSGIYQRTPEQLERLREAGRKLGSVQGPKNAKSGRFQSVEWKERAARQGRKNVESGLLERISLPSRFKKGEIRTTAQREASARGGVKTMLKIRGRQGPNEEEKRLRAELDKLGIEFKPEVYLGDGMGIADVVVGKVVGELDGGGHWVNFARKKGVTDEEYRCGIAAKDARHDKRRRHNGYVVIRDSDPIRLANRIKEVVQ